jgi:hypothetical protein
MSAISWDEPYPCDVVKLRHSKHYARRRTHLCADCFKDIKPGERYICTVYVDQGKIAQYKIHDACPYSWNVLKWIRSWL